LFREASFTLALGAEGNGGDRSGEMRGSSNGANSDRGPHSRSIWISVVGSVGAIVFVVFCLCKRRKRSRNLFEEAVRNAKSNVQQQPSYTFSFDCTDRHDKPTFELNCSTALYAAPNIRTTKAIHPCGAGVRGKLVVVQTNERFTK
jgi:hypothetical protein